MQFHSAYKCAETSVLIWERQTETKRERETRAQLDRTWRDAYLLKAER